METRDGNKLIAEFMGRKLGYHKWPIGKYNSSWDWLMPVVEKIEKGFDERIFHSTIESMFKWNGQSYDHVYQSYIGENAENIFESGKEDSRIKSVYVAVIGFITWYNNTKK